MDWSLIVKMIPLATTLITSAESAFIEYEKSGAFKKCYVMTGLKSIVEGIEALSKGGQLATWQKIESDMGTVVDSLVSIMNGMGKNVIQ
jgi:hypothetical protein